MADWYLEDLKQDLHKATFVSVTSVSVARSMKWDPKIKWNREFQMSAQDGRNVYALIDDRLGRIHGAISMSDKEDHVFVHLIESATHNRLSPRMFVNVARLLIAFAGQRSNQIPNGDGFLALTPKSNLIQYYENRFKAFHLTGNDMGIDGAVTNHWIRLYYK